MANVTVTGNITKHLADKGFNLTETITLNDGRSFDKYWTVWGKQAPIGDTVTVTGELGTKILKDHTTGEDKISAAGNRIVELTVNNATITTTQTAMPF